MTKKDYVALAAALKVLRRQLDTSVEGQAEDASNTVRMATWNECVLAVMRVCAADNPNFHRGKFVAACGVPNIGVK